MIGDIGEHQKVACLWTEFSATIQTELWKTELNPKSSSFREVKSAAEIIEIAHLVPTCDRDRCPKDKAPKNEVNSGDNLRGLKGDAPGCGNWNDQRWGNNRYPKCGEPKAEGSNKMAGTSRDLQPKGGKTKGASGGHQPEKMRMAEQECHTAEGLCYVCHQAGHISRNCPQKMTVKKSSQSNGPPAMQNYNIEVDLLDADRT